MKHTKYLLVFVVALAISIPVGMTALASDDPAESPEASSSERPEVSKSPRVSETPDIEDDNASDSEDGPEVSETPRASVTPKIRGTVKPSKTPEQEDVEDQQDAESEDVEETPEISVPPEMEDDVAELASDDHDLLGVGVDKENKSVEVKYRLRAKLFGFIDVPYELEAHVDRSADEVKVETKGPWWLLFARDNAGEVQSALEADPTLADATNQGTILSTILGILKSLAGKGQ